jgi:hypothetical protein
VQVYKHFSWFRVKHFRQKQEESLKYKIKRDKRLKGAGHLRARQIFELKDTLALNSSKYWGYSKPLHLVNFFSSVSLPK